MPAATIAQTIVQYAPQAISIAKGLVAKFAPQIASTVETASQAISTVADSGIAQSISEARNLISSDTDFGHRLITISAYLSNSHPELALKFQELADKLLAKVELTNEEIGFIHDELNKISSTQEEPKDKPEAVADHKKEEGSKKPVELQEDDINILIKLVAEGDPESEKVKGYIQTLKSQTLIPQDEVNRRYKTAIGKLDTTNETASPEKGTNEPVEVHSGGIDLSSPVLLEDLGADFKDLKPEDQAKLLLTRMCKSFEVAEGQKISYDFAARIFRALGVNPDVLKLDEVKQFLGDIPESSDSDPEKANLQRELEEAKNKNRELKAVLDGNKTKANAELDKNPIEFLSLNIKNILIRELKDKSSLLGLAQEVLKGAKGMGLGGMIPEGLSKLEDLGSFLDELVLTDKFKSSLAQSIRGEKVDVDSLGFNEFQKHAYKVADWSVWAINKLPSVAINYFPLLVNVMKWSLPFGRIIPIFGHVIPKVYPILDEVSKFIGKFQLEAEGIQKASSLIRGETVQPASKPEEAPKEEPKKELAGAAGK